MTDFEKAYRKMEIKEQNGMDSDKEFADALSSFIAEGETHRDYNPERSEKEAREMFAKEVGILPRSDAEENISIGLDTLEALAKQIRKNLKEVELKEAVSRCVALEPKLSVAAHFLFWEICSSREPISEEGGNDSLAIKYAKLGENTDAYEDAWNYYNSMADYIMTLRGELKRYSETKRCPNLITLSLSLMSSKSEEMRWQESDRKEGLLSE